MWGAHEIVTGAPLVADLDPNTVAPGTTRTWVTGRSTNTVRALLIAGVSVTLVPWAYESSLGLWLQIDSKLITPAAPTIVDVVPDARMFFQITAVIGAPTNLVIAP